MPAQPLLNLVRPATDAHLATLSLPQRAKPAHAALDALMEALMPGHAAALSFDFTDTGVAAALDSGPAMAWLPPPPASKRTGRGSLAVALGTDAPSLDRVHGINDMATVLGLMNTHFVWCGAATDPAIDPTHDRFARVWAQAGRSVPDVEAVTALMPRLMAQPSSFDLVIFAGPGSALMLQAFAERAGSGSPYGLVALEGSAAQMSHDKPVTGQALSALLVLSLVRAGLMEAALRLWDTQLFLAEHRIFSAHEAELAPYATNLPLADYIARLSADLGAKPRRGDQRLAGSPGAQKLALALV